MIYKKASIIKMNEEIIRLPIIPLKETNVYPGTVIPIIVGLPPTLAAVEYAVKHCDSRLICLTLKADTDQGRDYPDTDDVYRDGFIAQIIQIIKMPNQKLRILLGGRQKVCVDTIINSEFLMGEGRIIPEEYTNHLEAQAIKDKLKSECIGFWKLTRKAKPELLEHIDNLDNPFELLYFIVMNIELTTQERQAIITENDFLRKARTVLRKMAEKSEYIKLQKSIDNEVYGRINKLQREHYLSEQLKTIHKELGLESDAATEVQEFKEKMKKLDMSEEAQKAVNEELKKLMRIPPHSPEYYVVYNYLTWIFDLPWQKPEIKKIDILEAEKILDEDHYGLEKIKQRILEYLAVIQFNVNSKAQILCFIGPPGVGKTSLGKSIARALGREFIRLSVGGVSDEAEIRGHRKTYIGSMPGIIIQSLKKAGTTNTLIMIDEIDKLGKDFKGDPSSALLEVLDPEQNNTFRDHFLDFGFDLSNVFFITTANNQATIPLPLQDRMEIIKLSSYTEHEKTAIAKGYLIPKKIKEFATEGKLNLHIPEKTIKEIIRNYTAEAGVRELERNLNALFRKTIMKHLKKEVKKTVAIDTKRLKEFLGTPIFTDKDLQRKDAIGIAYGMAWTPVGGEILPVEATCFPGTGKFQMTGNIGKVMNESAKAAISLTHKNYEKWGIAIDNFKKIDLHIHIPEGAVPKDGPSAGITLTIAIVSLLAGVPVDHKVAMTGEISLTGRILPIGGLTEKVVAAQRYGFTKVILPEGNRKNWDDLKPEAKKGINFVFVETVEDVIAELGLTKNNGV